MQRREVINENGRLTADYPMELAVNLQLAVNQARTEALGSSLKRHQVGTHTFGGDGTVAAHRNCVYPAAVHPACIFTDSQ